jgi:insertion element IS1 protein InsB
MAYALRSDTRQVIDFVVGKRTKQVLAGLVQSLLLSSVRIIKTDRSNFRSLIPISRHVGNAYDINHIERNNLNIRTHLKRLLVQSLLLSQVRIIKLIG